MNDWILVLLIVLGAYCLMLLLSQWRTLTFFDEDENGDINRDL